MPPIPSIVKKKKTTRKHCCNYWVKHDYGILWESDWFGYIGHFGAVSHYHYTSKTSPQCYLCTNDY